MVLLPLLLLCYAVLASPHHNEKNRIHPRLLSAPGVQDNKINPIQDSKYVGSLFAGRLEFNWIVDIRVENQDQEGWAIGNLISRTMVLTVCHIFSLLEQHAKPTPVIKVHYCTLYLWEKFKQKDVFENDKWSYKTEEDASRVSTRIQKHSKCDNSKMSFDASVIELDREIPFLSMSPFIGNLPIALHIQSDISNAKNKRALCCYVASFGRNYYNEKNHIVVDYKVKLRAYFTPWSQCTDQLSKICGKNDGACADTPENRKTTMCFESKSRVGAICNHDRGAPLVCQGDEGLWFQGMVIRAAQWSHCNNLQPVPFLVLKKHQEYVHRVSFYDDPELRWKLRGYPQENTFYNNRTGAQYVGLLYAGRAEFPWIVDIRTGDFPSWWSIGNLISFNLVMTTCRAILFLEREASSASRTVQEDTNVYFCSAYLWEQPEQLDVYRDVEFNIDRSPWNGGKRWISTATRHSLCQGSFQNLGDGAEYVDAGMLKLTEGIPPFVPLIGYMPILMNQAREVITQVDLTRQKEQRKMCFIGAYGRPYRNIERHAAVDYKTRIRTYYTEWAECIDRKRYICPTYERPCIPPRNSNLMCFETRAKVGAVCDNQRGAPLVCEGEVYGMVTNGANSFFCNDVMPMPFVVLKISAARDFYMEQKRANPEFLGK